MATPLRVAFTAGPVGEWRIDSMSSVIGESLHGAAHLAVTEGSGGPSSGDASWVLRGVTSNTRYTHRREAELLAATQEGLGKPTALRAALIPIRKTPAWWALSQDERRDIFEEQSRHIGIGMTALPAVSRRLHHSRDLGEPFDFLTWFEYAPHHAEAFERMVAELRATTEWRYIDREIDIRLSRTGTTG